MIYGRCHNMLGEGSGSGRNNRNKKGGLNGQGVLRGEKRLGKEEGAVGELLPTIFPSHATIRCL